METHLSILIVNLSLKKKQKEGMQVCHCVTSIDYVTMDYLTHVPPPAWEGSEHCQWKDWCFGLRSTGKCLFALGCE